MQLYMTVTPEQYGPAAGGNYRLSHAAYQIGQDQHLHRRTLSRQAQSGLLALCDLNPPPIRESSALCREILRECSNRGYEGVAADFGQNTTPDRLALLEELGPLLHRNSKKLFVSSAYGRHVPTAYVLINTALSGGTLSTMLADAWELGPLLHRNSKKLFVSSAYGRHVPTAYVLINTALSGGTLSTMLADACHAFGWQRVALDIERLRMDFLLPSPTGEGTSLSADDFRTLWAEVSPSVFFSHELGAKYFTYHKDGSAHFVLFDDADTIRFKLNMGKNMDLRWAFLLCSEVEDLLPQLR